MDEDFHGQYSPSRAERFFACEGSTNLLKRVPPRPPQTWTIEGKNAHIVLETALKNGYRDAQEAHNNSVVFFVDVNDSETHFYRSVQMAIDYVFDIMDRHPDAKMYVEQRVFPPGVTSEASGTSDVIIVVPSLRTVYVIDFKHGQGVAKDAEENKQMLQYGAGAIFGDNPLCDPNQTSHVVLVIIQPRAFHKDGPIREWDTIPYRIWEYIGELEQAITKNEQPDAPLRPDDNGKTTDHCRFCDAKTVCPAREQQALNVAALTFKQIEHVTALTLPVPTLMQTERLAQIRFMAPILRKWLDDCEAHCYELARAGHYIKGAKLVETQARRKYYGSEEEVAAKLAALAQLPVEKVMRKSIIPIGEAEDLIVDAYQRRVTTRAARKKAAMQARNDFAFLTLKQSSGNLVLVDESDERPAVNATRQYFAGVSGLIPER